MYNVHKLRRKLSV